MHMCKQVNVLVPPLSSCKIFALACLRDSDLLCSLCKVTRHGVIALCYTNNTQLTKWLI